MNHYFTNSTLDDKAGTGVSVAVFTTDDAGDFNGVQMGADGKPYFGYLAQEVTAEEFAVWKKRIASPDMVTYFPGRFPGVGVVNKAIYDAIQAEAQVARLNAQRVTPRQAKAWLITNDLDEALEAGILSIADNGQSDAVKQSKLVWNWYENTSSWRYGNEHLTAAFKAVGIDKDKFFAQAAKL